MKDDLVYDLVLDYIDDVMNGIGQDQRIGSQFLKPGPGWGGSCFPKDTRALVKIAETSGYDFALLRGVIDFNEIQFDRIVQKVRKFTGGPLTGKTIALLGLTFKANTNDLRDSPALRIGQMLVTEGAKIRGYDPTVSASFDGVHVCKSAVDACTNADVVLITTEWAEFSKLDPGLIATVVASRQVVDARNILDANQWRRAGFEYQGVGR